MFERILYPTDFSEVSKEVLDYIKGLNKACVQEVVVLHVLDVKYLDSLFLDTRKVLETETALLKKARKDLLEIVDELEQCGFKTKGRVEIAVPFKEIIRIEEEEKISLIIIGSHGKSNMEEIILGSVSEKVVRKAKGPVLLIKRSSPEDM